MTRYEALKALSLTEAQIKQHGTNLINQRFRAIVRQVCAENPNAHIKIYQEARDCLRDGTATHVSQTVKKASPIPRATLARARRQKGGLPDAAQ